MSFIKLVCSVLLVACSVILVECRSYNTGLIFYNLETHNSYLPPTISVSRGRGLSKFQYSSRGSIWSTFGKPCDCQGPLCGCCVGIKVKQYNFDQKMCANVTYAPRREEVQLTVVLNDTATTRYGIAARNPSPLCVPIMMGIPMSMCIQMSNIGIQGDNLNMCMDFLVRLASTELFEMHFQCMKVGLQGAAWVGADGNPVIPSNENKIKDRSSNESMDYYDEGEEVEDEMENEIVSKEKGEEEDLNKAEEVLDNNDITEGLMNLVKQEEQEPASEKDNEIEGMRPDQFIKQEVPAGMEQIVSNIMESINENKASDNSEKVVEMPFNMGMKPGDYMDHIQDLTGSIVTEIVPLLNGSVKESMEINSLVDNNSNAVEESFTEGTIITNLEESDNVAEESVLNPESHVDQEAMESLMESNASVNEEKNEIVSEFYDIKENLQSSLDAMVIENDKQETMESIKQENAFVINDKGSENNVDQENIKGSHDSMLADSEIDKEEESMENIKEENNSVNNDNNVNVSENNGSEDNLENLDGSMVEEPELENDKKVTMENFMEDNSLDNNDNGVKSSETNNAQENVQASHFAIKIDPDSDKAETLEGLMENFSADNDEGSESNDIQANIDNTQETDQSMQIDAHSEEIETTTQNHSEMEESNDMMKAPTNSEDVLSNAIKGELNLEELFENSPQKDNQMESNVNDLPGSANENNEINSDPLALEIENLDMESAFSDENASKTEESTTEHISESQETNEIENLEMVIHKTDDDDNIAVPATPETGNIDNFQQPMEPTSNEQLMAVNLKPTIPQIVATITSEIANVDSIDSQITPATIMNTKATTKQPLLSNENSAVAITFIGNIDDNDKTNNNYSEAKDEDDDDDEDNSSSDKDHGTVDGDNSHENDSDYEEDEDEESEEDESTEKDLDKTGNNKKPSALTTNLVLNNQKEFLAVTQEHLTNAMNSNESETNDETNEKDSEEEKHKPEEDDEVKEIDITNEHHENPHENDEEEYEDEYEEDYETTTIALSQSDINNENDTCCKSLLALHDSTIADKSKSNSNNEPNKHKTKTPSSNNNNLQFVSHTDTKVVSNDDKDMLNVASTSNQMSQITEAPAAFVTTTKARDSINTMPLPLARKLFAHHQQQQRQQQQSHHYQQYHRYSRQRHHYI